ncbi:MAG: phosphotransferase [Syntrophales bacterium]|nr:phosphotransferase [Syntrophales bacterium]
MNYSDEEIGASARKAMGLAEKTPLEVIPLAMRGSQRSFCRIRYGNRESVIFMQYCGERRENNYYAGLARFLQKIGLSVPQIFYHDGEKNFLLMEDLGERDLWHYRQAPWEERRRYYFKTLDIIRKLHAFRQEDSSLAGVAMMEAFDAHLYRWERDYFRENFVRGVCGIELDASEAEMVEKELVFVAEALEGSQSCLVHRDLQSQNVMIRGDDPALIDFQGMRYGNPLYDLGSLLYDPYVSFTGAERQELLDYYYVISATGCDFRTFGENFRKASVQRLLQALGAYGFLGLKGNRREFLTHISSGLNNLIEAMGTSPAFNHLNDLALRCRQALEKRGSA